MSRIAAFVRAARALLWMQVVAALLATGLGVWAIVAVRDLAAERDLLADQVLELQRGRPEAGPTATPAGVAPSPLDSEVRPPAIMPVYVPIVTDPAVTPPIPPVDVPPPPTDVTPDTGGSQNPPTANECSSPNADPRRCRPGRWTRPNRPVTMQPVPQPVEQPQRGSDPARLD